ncbi:hypothetical protein AAHA92_21992 [Salvia divinorum]|uniref:Uncharacterized protein n=1 Tax=Salvia divinorum TaxID=28513 RepID=A0ABD1GM83_SALDI
MDSTSSVAVRWLRQEMDRSVTREKERNSHIIESHNLVLAMMTHPLALPTLLAANTWHELNFGSNTWHGLILIGDPKVVIQRFVGRASDSLGLASL